MTTLLRELRVTQGPSLSAGSIHLELEYAEIYGHPPEFNVLRGRVAKRASRSARQARAMDVQVEELDRWAETDGFHFPSTLINAVFEVGNDLLAHAVAPPEWGPLPPGSTRLVIAGPHHLSRYPWESLSRLDARWGNVAIVRQLRPVPSLRSRRPLTFPIGIAVVADAWPDAGMASFFDDFVQHGLPPGIVEGVPPEAADVLHLALTDLSSADEFLRRAPAPRVVVVQLPFLPSTRDAQLLASMTLQQGAWAVVVAGIPVTEVFSRYFYRKIFHNWPLDFAALGARTRSSGPAEAARLYVLEGGEFALSLTRIPLEQALAGPRVAAQTEAEKEGRRGSWSYLRAPSSGAPASVREKRAMESVRLRVEQALESKRLGSLAARMADLSKLNFGTEAHDVLEVKRAAEEVTKQLLQDGDELEAVGGSAAPVRLINVTVLNRAGDGPVPTDRPLLRKIPYRMRVAIEPAPGVASVSMEFDEKRLRAVFERQDRVNLDVVVFAPEDEVDVQENRAPLSLPRVGPSGPVEFVIVLKRDGWCRLRIGVFYRNTLLQSLAVELYAGPGQREPEGSRTVRLSRDWAASTDLLLLDELPAPDFCIFTNDAPDGSHWIGVFSSEGEDRLPLRSGQMRKLDSQDVTRRADDLRGAMQHVHGAKNSYEYPASGPQTPEVVAFGAKALLEMAKCGHEVYKYLFEQSTDISAANLRTMRLELKGLRQGIISVARCNAKWTIPWAALYDLPLDVDRVRDHTVCPVFEAQLAGNEWDAEGRAIQVTRDLLADPVACRAQEGCPLGGPDAIVTICPFGFWGFRNQIEQPLQQVDAPAEGEVPPQMKQSAFSQSSFIARSAAEPLRVGAGAYPFPLLEEHEDELRALLGSGLQWQTDREEVVKLLYDPNGHHIFYFYCHGVEGTSFTLEVGPKGGAHNRISAASLEVDNFRWGKLNAPQPLVVLVACESSAMRPETMHGFFGLMANAEASGVLGSEITIGTRLGREWGYRLLAAVRAGSSVGEAMLEIGHDLLRRHNPLGLAFTSFAPATLHLCEDPEGNGSCRRYHRKRVLE